MKQVQALAAIGLLGALVCPPVSAQPEWTEETKITFSTPVQIPGMTLPPGTYTFRLANPEAGRNVLQIFDATGQRLITTKVVIPKQRTQPTGDLFLELAEFGQGGPPALMSWFYPGKVLGHEFVYSRDEAQRIADRSRQDVLSGDLDAKDKESWQKGSVTRVKPGARQ
jgi:hypothetical protein